VGIVKICGDEDGEKYSPVVGIGDRKQIRGGAGSRKAYSAHFIPR
jgi:hypothetical protein